MNCYTYGMHVYVCVCMYVFLECPSSGAIYLVQTGFLIVLEFTK